MLPLRSRRTTILRGPAFQVAERIRTGASRRLPRKFSAVSPKTGAPSRPITLTGTVRRRQGFSCAERLIGMRRRANGSIARFMADRLSFPSATTQSTHRVIAAQVRIARFVGQAFQLVQFPIVAAQAISLCYFKYVASQSRNVLYHSSLFCGLRIQCPSSG